MNTALTPEILLSHGFVELERKDVLDRPIYSLQNIKSKYGEYGFDIWVVLNPKYTNSNPNCGILSLHSPAYEYQVIPEDLLTKEEWTEEDMERAKNSVEIAEETTQPIAWHLTTYERLKTIVKSLTLMDLEYGRK